MARTNIRVAHVVELSRGGPTTAVLQLLRHQTASSLYADPVLVACRNLISQDLSDEPTEKHLYTSSRNPFRFRSVACEVGALLDRIKPDIVHLHSTFAGIYVRLALRHHAARPKVLYSPHGWSFAQDVSPLKKLVYAIVERALLPQTDAILNISQHEERLARAWRITAPKDALIPHGIADCESNIATMELGLDRSKINLGFFGRLDRQKGVDLLIDELLRKPRPHIALTIVGSALRDTTTYDFARAGIRKIDWVPHAQIDAHIRAFDAIIMPSRWEGFSFTPLEAMRNSRPVIVSNRASLPEVVIDGYNGIVFDLDAPRGLGNALDRLEGLDLDAMGRNARAVYQDSFQEASMLRKLDSLYAAIMRRAP